VFGGCLTLLDQVQELLTGLRVVTEHAQHGRRHSLGVDLLHASHHHAHVYSFDDYSNTHGLDSFSDSDGNLFGQTLLNLQPPAVDLDDPGQLGESEDLLVRQVADGDFAVEGDEVVFAHGEHLDVLHHDHLVVVLVEHRVVQHVFKTLVVALGEEEHGLGSSLWSLEKPLTVRVLAERAEQHAVGVGHVG